ncbi:esterase/lipase/thioesterase [Metarhizium guizhouense ARSEF 977]|uniref:Esterase/lipase/thioesterase n=1 Tax=Metarhizium guizhouense (strain ARSEF 977) TaxID=1276136 RepID=A0A0B4HPY2_METGA|nr:esterase/lipase/thioesterase [Metarhizium guizhouense ARSEF 977]
MTIHHNLQSDLELNVSKLQLSAVSQETIELNRHLQELELKCPRWFDVGAVEYRRMRKLGQTPLIPSISVPSAVSDALPSRDKGRTIPCRILRPSNSSVKAGGLLLHFHGGGWVLNDEESSDTYLQSIADSCQLVCISAGYRLAPEHPFPAGPEDCMDVAQWLIANGAEKYGASLAFICGESAGANLALVTSLGLLRSPLLEYANFRLKGLLLHYGAFSLLWQPGTRLFQKDSTLVLDEETLDSFRKAYLTHSDIETITSPQISPFYADLNGIQLPEALITCGTNDCLLEDSVFMSTRWILAGGKAVLKLYPGSSHGFILFSPDRHENTKLALSDVATFIRPKLIVDSSKL